MRNPLHRRLLHTVALNTVLLVSISLLSGCMATPTPHNTSVPSAAAPTMIPPVFASNEEALAAAMATYSAYLSAGDVAGKIGSDSWNKYLAFTNGPEHDAVMSSRTALEAEGRSLTGSTTFDSIKIQMSSALPDATWEIRTYLCLDITHSRLLDSSGQPIDDSEGPLRWPMVVRFVTPQKDSQQLLISESTIWSGSNFC